MPIDRRSARALYLQLADIIRSDIENGVLLPGDRLMSESEMVKRYGVARLTVRESLSLLVSEGLVEKHHGKGSFVRSDAPKRKIDVLLDISDHYFIPYYLKGICSVFEMENATLITKDTKNSHTEIARQLRTVAERGSDGIILQGCPYTDFDREEFDEILSLLKKKNIPIMLIDYNYGYRDVPSAVMDEYLVGRLAAECAERHSHTKAIAVSVCSNYESVTRCEGFCSVISDCEIINAEPGLDSLISAVERTGATVIFCFSDSYAGRCADILETAGYKIPSDISLISVDDTVLARAYNITSVAHPKERLAEYAASEILSPMPHKTKVFIPAITERASVKKL